ncbi:hypothetical protein KRP22_006043 [Phytophthora ramorum]|nr:hypothetical protein KRP22_2827 [Phytophthora ramorum]
MDQGRKPREEADRRDEQEGYWGTRCSSGETEAEREKAFTGEVPHGSRNKAVSMLPSTGKKGDGVQEEGRAVFLQLRAYLSNDTPASYVFHTVKRMQEVTKEKRFKEHRSSLKLAALSEAEEQQLRTEWKDEPAQGLLERYQGLVSYWAEDSAEHRQRFNFLMKEWVLQKALTQAEMERRIQFFQFEETQEDKKLPVGMVVV